MNLTLKLEFEKLNAEKSHLTNNWEDYAAWTLPYIYRNANSNTTEILDYDFNALGAQAVNNLANKIVQVLFPHGKPFFRLTLTETQKAQLGELNLDLTQIDEILSTAEKAATLEMSKSNIITAVLEAIKTLIITGNSLIYIPDDKDEQKVQNAVQVFALNDYVIQRDMGGRHFKIITRDAHTVATLPEDIRQEVLASKSNNLDITEKVTIYTGIEKQADGRFRVWQEIDDLLKTQRQEGLYTAAELPWIPLTWNLSRGYNYGTGLVEEYSGAFASYSNLAEAVSNISAIMADIKGLVDPMGSTDVETLNDSPAGTWVHGNIDDLSFLQLEKQADLNFLNTQMAVHEKVIGSGFLLNSAVTRSAERVTAEEIRLQAQELQGAFGGVYGKLAETLQLPLAKREVAKLGDDFKDIEPLIITGRESLSRQTERDTFMLFFTDLAALAELPDRVTEILDFPVVVSKLGAMWRVEYKDMILDEETVQANRQARQAEEAQQAAASKPQPPQPQQETF